MLTRSMSYLAHPGIPLIAAAMMLGAGSAAANEAFSDLFLDANPMLDIRYRYEHVDQDGFARRANAHTVRTRAGLETGRFHGFGAGFDVEWIEAIGEAKFNDTINGKTRYPTVADPDDFQLNQLFLVSENTVPGTTFKLGRQRIVWDNARFVGNVGFRQNEQTFDAARVLVTALPETTLEYAYLDGVRRIFGTDSPDGDFAMQSHGIRAQYAGLDALSLTPFALLLDYDASARAGLDSQTYGIGLDGKQKLSDDWTLLYSGALAHQSDYQENPRDFGLWYYALEPGVRFSGITLKAGYEVLEGDGTSAFQTPLATLHKFNGFTDQFLTTPPDGLEDLHLSLNVDVPAKGWLSGLSIEGNYHEYWAEKGGAHYGSEWDLGVFKKIPLDAVTLNLGLQYAAYSADKYAKDIDKLWLTLQVTLNPKPLRNLFGAGETVRN